MEFAAQNRMVFKTRFGERFRFNGKCRRDGVDSGITMCTVDPDSGRERELMVVVSAPLGVAVVCLKSMVEEDWDYAPVLQYKKDNVSKIIAKHTSGVSTNLIMSYYM